MGRPPYILIAEDDADDRFLINAAFKEKRLAVQLSFVQDGVQVMDYLGAIDNGHSLPDLIVLDLNMPLMDGSETLKKLKENERYKTIPVIMHSTSDDETDKNNCMNMGASGYLHKGSDFNMVRASVQFIYEFILGNG